MHISTFSPSHTRARTGHDLVIFCMRNRPQIRDPECNAAEAMGSRLYLSLRIT